MLTPKEKSPGANSVEVEEPANNADVPCGSLVPLCPLRVMEASEELQCAPCKDPWSVKDPWQRGGAKSVPGNSFYSHLRCPLCRDAGVYDGIGLEASDNVGRETVQRNVGPPRTSTATTDVAHATDVRVRGGACHLPADEAGDAETLGNEGDEDSDDDRSQFTGIGDISLLQFEFIDDTLPTDVFEKITDEDEEEEYFECNPDRDDDIQICPVDAEPDLRTDRKGTLLWATFDSGAGRSCTSKALAENMVSRRRMGRGRDRSLSGQAMKSTATWGRSLFHLRPRMAEQLPESSKPSMGWPRLLSPCPTPARRET